jgi:hypothetical protein
VIQPPDSVEAEPTLTSAGSGFVFRETSEPRSKAFDRSAGPGWTALPAEGIRTPPARRRAAAGDGGPGRDIAAPAGNAGRPISWLFPGKAERVASIMGLLVAAPLWILAYYLDEEQLSVAAEGLRILAGVVYLGSAVLIIAALLRLYRFRRG